MYSEAVRPDLYAGSVAQGLTTDDHLHYAAIVDITARAHHLQDVGGGVIMSEVITVRELKIKREITNLKRISLSTRPDIPWSGNFSLMRELTNLLMLISVRVLCSRVSRSL